jgi:hypothetical protein
MGDRCRDSRGASSAAFGRSCGRHSILTSHQPPSWRKI